MSKNLYLHPNEMVKEFQSLDYKQIKLLIPSTCIVNLMEKNGENLVVKVGRHNNDILDWMKTSLFTEKNRLEVLKGYNRIPEIKNFYNLSSRARKSDLIKGNVLIDPYILEKEFIAGEKLNLKNLTKKDKFEIKEIVNYFHNHGVSNLDVTKNNFIRNSERGIVMIDVGGNSKYSKKTFEENKKEDLIGLEKLIS